MPQTKTYTVYTFDELSDEAKEKALDECRDHNTDDNWHDFVIEYWQDEKLPAMGFQNAKIAYSGFWSQGDGASFTCKAESFDVLEFLKSQKALKDFPTLVKYIRNESIAVNASVYRIDTYYSHENTVSVETEVVYYKDVSSELYVKIEKEEARLNGLIKEVVRSTSRQIYNELEESYESLRTDEAVKDTILANEYTFDINGKRKN